MFCVGGARGIFRSNISDYSSVPSSTTVTYEGIFNSTYLKLNSKEEKKTINLEISLASVINPISNENEIWLGTLLKSKYDGQKINKLIDLSIALDVSGSMSGSRIDMAKKSLIQLIQKLNDEDNITISIFNNESKPIFPYQKVSELKKIDYIPEIEKLNAHGGTDILKAFKSAYDLMSKENCNKNKIRRIIIITDMEDRANEEMTKFCEKISLEGIYITILGISSDFRTDLAEMTSHIKGANYVVIKESKDINKYLVEDFEYLCFQNATDLTLEVTTPNIKIERIVGSGKEGIEKIFETISNMYKFKEIEIDDSITITNNRHKQAINNMLLSVQKAEESIKEKMPIDVVTIHITDILSDIGNITGESISEDIISEIFKKFCLGK